jgi:predicted membrane protein
VLWLIGQLGLHLHVAEIFSPFQMLFGNMVHLIFSWPMILILIGLILVAGNRSGGWILVIIGGISLLPRIFLIPSFPVSIIFPLFLILAGGALIIRRL